MVYLGSQYIKWLNYRWPCRGWLIYTGNKENCIANNGESLKILRSKVQVKIHILIKNIYKVMEKRLLEGK